MKGIKKEPRVITRRADFRLSIYTNDANDSEFGESS
jgi:hypothetical protein